MRTTHLLFLLVCIGAYYAQVQYQLTQVQGSSCIDIEQFECVQCGNYYYSAQYDGNSGYYAMYTNSACTYFYSGYFSVYPNECGAQLSNCSIVLVPLSASYYTATISSATTLKVGTTWPREEEFLSLSLTSSHAEVLGFLELIQFRTPNTKLVYEALLSPQKYSTNLGVFNFGTSYTKGDLTFVVNRVANQSFPSASPPEYAVAFSPFTNVHVTNSAEYNIGLLSEGVVVVETDSSYNLDGLVIGLLNYSDIHSMSLYPAPYSETDPKLVFEVSSSDEYWTFPCDGASSDPIIFCDFSSTYIIIIGASGSFPPFGSFSSFGGLSFSFSLDANPRVENNKVDDMAFSLF